MNNSLFSKTLFSLTKILSEPRASLSWVRRGHLARDRMFISQTYWCTGVLPRVPLAEILPEAKQAEVCLPRACDRKLGTSVTVEEACHLCLIARCLRPRKVLEIGTYDGNTTLALAANLEQGDEVVTVDLPPDFDTSTDQASLVYFDKETFNLTPRNELGRQYRTHPLSRRIKQVYGDSAALDWKTLGGPFGLIFIDGCHSAAYVRSDSQNALTHLAAGGAIVWHDYGMIPDVSNEVDRIAREEKSLRVSALEGTRLAIGIKVAGGGQKSGLRNQDEAGT